MEKKSLPIISNERIIVKQHWKIKSGEDSPVRVLAKIYANNKFLQKK